MFKTTAEYPVPVSFDGRQTWVRTDPALSKEVGEIKILAADTKLLADRMSEVAGFEVGITVMLVCLVLWLVVRK